ncbi:MAG: hypothetical protein V3T77_11220 [Planctomycetota bacterium]
MTFQFSSSPDLQPLKRLALTGLLMAFFFPASAWGDRFVLKDGRRLKGSIVEKSAAVVRIVTADGFVSVASDDIVRHRTSKSLEKRYQTRLKRAPNEVGPQLKLAKWCRREGVEQRARQHFRHVLRLDPKHTEAHLALGHERGDDGWRSKHSSPERQPAILKNSSNSAPTGPNRSRGDETVHLELGKGFNPEHAQYLQWRLQKFLRGLDQPMRLHTGEGSGSEQYLLKISLTAAFENTHMFYGKVPITSSYRGRVSLKMVSSKRPREPVVRFENLNHLFSASADLPKQEALGYTYRETIDKLLSRLSRNSFFKGRGAKPIPFSAE